MMSILLLTLTLQGQPPANQAALDNFVAQIDREWPGETRQQAITTESLKLMADAIAAVAARHGADSPALKERLQRFRDESERYAAGKPGTDQQSRQLRRTFLAGVDTITSISPGAGRQLKARLSALERAARGLDDDDPVLRQPDVIERYFRHAAEVLKIVDSPNAG